MAKVRLTARPAFDITGVAISPVGPETAHTGPYLQLLSIDDAGEEHRRAVADQFLGSGGAFTFTNLPPGDYVLSAIVSDRFWAEQKITIEDRSLSDVQVRLLPTIVVSGTIVWEGVDQPPDRSRLIERRNITALGGSQLSSEEASRLETLFPIALAAMMPVGRVRPSSLRSYAVTWASNNTFTLRVPRDRFLASHARLNGWLVKSLRINGREATDEPVDIDSDSTSAVLTLTRALGEVRGAVVTAAGGPDQWCPVVLFSTNPRVWPGLYASYGHHVFRDTSDETGRFTFQGVLPGDYYLAAITSAEWWQLNPELLDRLASSAVRIQVPANVPVSRTLTRAR